MGLGPLGLLGWVGLGGRGGALLAIGPGWGEHAKEFIVHNVVVYT